MTRRRRWRILDETHVNQHEPNCEIINRRRYKSSVMVISSFISQVLGWSFSFILYSNNGDTNQFEVITKHISALFNAQGLKLVQKEILNNREYRQLDCVCWCLGICMSLSITTTHYIAMTIKIYKIKIILQV